MVRYQTLWIPILAWLTVQVWKFLADMIKNRRINIKRLVETGGMPSSHTATVAALVTVIGLTEGIDSTIFAVAFVFAVVVMYDAAGVRRAAGKQAGILNQLIYSNQVKVNTNEKLKELLGHTPVEVLCGAVYGVVLATVIVLCMR